MSIQEATKISTRCKEMRSWWEPRTKKIKDWYRLIQMEDQLAQEKMESFVSNDPRAAFNITVGMLDAEIPHRIRPEQLEQANFEAADQIKDAYALFWRKVNEVHRLGGKQRWMSDFLGYLIATGWYSVFANMSPDGKQVQAEIWNPAEVYQVYDGVLAECCRITMVQPEAIKRLLARNRWTIDGPITQAMELYDYWKIDDSLEFPWNAVVIGNHPVKPMVEDKRFTRIPIFTNPAGGLPDNGAITANDKWRGEVGQSSLATNERMTWQTNKWWSFMMQILRDTAQPISYEKAAGGAVILQPGDKFKRGTHLRMGQNDDFGFITAPPIPLEIRGLQLDMEAMMEKGGVPRSLYGAPQGRVSQGVMATMAQAAHTLAKPFHSATVDCITDIDNFWYQMWRKNGYKPYGVKFPTGLDENIEITADYEIQVPGQAANTATVSRMLNPEFRLTQKRIMEDFWPSIENPMEEMAGANAEDAIRHPINSAIALIVALKEQARVLAEAGDIESASLFTQAAMVAEQSIGLGQPPQPQAPQGQGAPPQQGPPQEGRP